MTLKSPAEAEPLAGGGIPVYPQGPERPTAKDETHTSLLVGRTVPGYQPFRDTAQARSSRRLAGARYLRSRSYVAPGLEGYSVISMLRAAKPSARGLYLTEWLLVNPPIDRCDRLRPEVNRGRCNDRRGVRNPDVDRDGRRHIVGDVVPIRSGDSGRHQLAGYAKSEPAVHRTADQETVVHAGIIA